MPREYPWLRPLLGVAALLVVAVQARAALGDAPITRDIPMAGSVALASGGAVAPILASDNDWPGVLRAGRDLQSDVERVTGMKPALYTNQPAPCADTVIVGTVGHSALIDRLVASGKIDVGEIRGKWESFLMQTVENPLPGTARALVIAGSDKRGTIYGIYELSEQMGVSPWYWWADVPVRHRSSVFVPPIRQVEGEPRVRYRGIFLNDEAPALAGWAKEKFGGFNHAFYARVFELLLRLRANYLWPAMWGNAFNEDDPENPRLADEFGIVMGTSHHEPMLRAQQEWKRHGVGPWNFAENPDGLTAFWTEGIRRNRGLESIVTIGMRGDGDVPMSQQSNIDLLERIVGVQRSIIAKETGADADRTPQLWALYKEVQDYFEKGMRVPDDVTLLWCDDNWGNIRRLPTPAERQRPGGAGIYYHFDYVGGPRSYKWLNTYPITKVWEQMHLATEYGANRIWIVNVGDLKPMEFPIEFFLAYAWAPDRWPSGRLGDFGRLWASREFGPEHAGEIAGIMEDYTKFNGRRKPEHVEPETYSIVNYDEADRVVGDWERLVARANEIQRVLPADARDAFYQLVLHPVAASATVTELNVASARSRLYAVQGRASTNLWAARARELFSRDASLARYWDEQLAGGKWRHFMDQTHLGYTTWQEPVRNAMPAVTELQLPAAPELGVAIEGSPNAWPTDNGNIPKPVLPELSPYGRADTHIEVFNRSLGAVAFSVEASVPWLHVVPSKGQVALDQRLEVGVDWDAVPPGASLATLTVASPGSTVRVAVPVSKPGAGVSGFVESDGCIAIEAPHFDRDVGSHLVSWRVLEGYGRTLGAVTAFPVTADSQVPGGDSPHLEYDLDLFHAGEAKVEWDVAPTLSFVPGHGLRFAVSLDDEAPQIEEYVARVGDDRGGWAESVLDGVRKVVSVHKAASPGRHVLKFWMVDPGVVLEKIVVDLGGVRPSYLGPPESARVVDPGQPAAKPLFRDPVYDGAADPVVIWNPHARQWWMYYTNRRANVPGLSGVAWVHGTRIGIAQSSDGGAHWANVGTADVELPEGTGGKDATEWAPEVVTGPDGVHHMYIAVVPGIFEDWEHPRTIYELTSTDLRTWRHARALTLSSDRVIDPCVHRLPDGTWRMWYNNERDGKSIYFADSPDLATWTDRGKASGVGERPGEGPYVFEWKGRAWMLVDLWKGLGVYSSDDYLRWKAQPSDLLGVPGHGPDDAVNGGHPGVVVSGGRAYCFYFTHPGRLGTISPKDRESPSLRRSSIQVVELRERDGQITCNRDEPTHIRLLEP